MPVLRAQRRRLSQLGTRPTQRVRSRNLQSPCSYTTEARPGRTGRSLWLLARRFFRRLVRGIRAQISRIAKETAMGPVRRPAISLGTSSTYVQLRPAGTNARIDRVCCTCPVLLKAFWRRELRATVRVGARRELDARGTRSWRSVPGQRPRCPGPTQANRVARVALIGIARRGAAPSEI